MGLRQPRGDGELDGSVDREAEVRRGPELGHGGEEVRVHKEEVSAGALDGPRGKAGGSGTVGGQAGRPPPPHVGPACLVNEVCEGGDVVHVASEDDVGVPSGHDLLLVA